MAPLTKLLKIREQIEQIKRECPNRDQVERGDLLSILIYTLASA
jgi:hypothetical protein